MKKLIAALGLIAVLAPAAAYSDQGRIAGIVNKILGKGKDDSAAGQPAPSKKKVKYIVRLRSGGTIETDNYDVLKDSVRIMLPAGAILLQKSEIMDIQQVVSDEGVTVQNNFPKPAKEAAPGPQRAAGPGSEHLVAPPAPVSTEITDNNGHDQYWWTRRIEEWKKKYDDAAAKYKDASDDWNRYNGLLLGVGGGTSQTNPSVSNYQVTQYQDLRGSARVRMDEAQREMDEAENMINQVLPDEAQKAGAPPGWVR